MQNTRLSSLDFDLGPEIDMLRTTVRGFAEERIAPLAAEIDKTDRFPIELWPEMGALGLHGITVEEEYGGGGMGLLPPSVAQEGGRRAPRSLRVPLPAPSHPSLHHIPPH